MMDPVIFREYDIRGVFEKEFDAPFAYLLGRAVVQYLYEKKGIRNPKLVIGIDARHSGTELKTAMSRGMQDSGAEVIFLGLVTSPISYFAIFNMQTDGGVMITGSHNPPEYNGFKVSIGKQTIFGDEIQELRKIIEKNNFVEGKGSERIHNIFDTYVERYQKEFGNLGNLKVVLDCGNGASGCIAKRLYESVGLKPTILFEKPDGQFPNHHPDPTVEKNLTALKAQVKKEGAVVGIGFDGDGDRIGLVDHTGKMIFGDELIVLLSRAVLQKEKGKSIVGDVKCSDRLFADIEKHGGKPVMWKAGHSLVKEKIKLEGAPLGGEMSGHIFFADRNYGYDDALYAGLRVCEILAQTKKTIPELLEGLPTSFNTPEIRVDTTEGKKHLIVKKLVESFPKGSSEYSINLLDGVRVSFKDGWALARASNTQPVLVLRFESNSADGLKRIRESFESVVNQYL